MPLEVMSSLPGHRASDTLRRSILHRRIGRLLDDGLRDLRVSVTALVQRGACECSDACRCCQLPANALALPLRSLVVELRQNIHALRSSLCILHSLTAYTTASTNLFSSFTSIYMYLYHFRKHIYIYTHTYIYTHKSILSVTPALLLVYI